MVPICPGGKKNNIQRGLCSHPATAGPSPRSCKRHFFKLGKKTPNKTPKNLLTVQKGKHLGEALPGQRLRHRPEPTQGQQKRPRNAPSRAELGVATPARDARCQQTAPGVPASRRHHVTKPGAKKIPQINTKKQKNPQQPRARRGGGGSFWLLCLALTCAWPLPVPPGVPARGPVPLRASARGEGWGGE